MKEILTDTVPEMAELKECRICPRKCGADRLGGKSGFCGATGDRIDVAHTMLHRWEEPPVSGTDPERGSGAVFFAHCNLGCIYCQNSAISGKNASESIRSHVTPVTVSELADIFLKLESDGAYNINLVTPTHYSVQIKAALRIAKDKGLNLPVVYNTGGYELPDVIRGLEGYADVFLTDYKYYSPETAEKYSFAPDYVKMADEALKVMTEVAGKPVFDSCGIIKKGVIVRHLVLPGHSAGSAAVFRRLFRRYRNGIVYSFMNQYTPMTGNPGLEKYPELNRPLTEEEYLKVTDEIEKASPKYAYIQEGGTVSESFIPLW